MYAESGPVATFFTKIAGGKHYPTFNVADMAIVTGAILLAILVFRGEPKAEGSADDSAPADPAAPTT